MSLDFALIGHQESWRAAANVISALRGPDRTPIPDDEVEEILPWIPPRAVCRVEARSNFTSTHDGKETQHSLGVPQSCAASSGISGFCATGSSDFARGLYSAKGLYIDTFIPPNRLGAAHLHENLARVRQAAACAVREEAKIVSLGGFSSILIEGNFDLIPHRGATAFTTGNSLTVALIVQGILKICASEGRDLSRATLLIVGATGDVGSGCARCLAPQVSRVLLHARNEERLHRLGSELEASGIEVELATDLRRFQAEADIVICAASLPSASLLLGRVAPDAVICDAGYPKNLAADQTMPEARVFFGGLGQISGGMRFEPPLDGVLNRHPFSNVVHGCLLEGMALALEGRFESFSQGRGFITPERVAEIEKIAARHGIALAPLYNADGPLDRLMEHAAALPRPNPVSMQIGEEKNVRGQCARDDRTILGGAGAAYPGIRQ